MSTSREIESIKRKILDTLNGKDCVPLIRMDEIRISEPIPEKLDRALKYPVSIRFWLGDDDKLVRLRPDWVATTDEKIKEHFLYYGANWCTPDELVNVLGKLP